MRWARRLPAVTVEVACGGAAHRVLLRRGRLVLVDHVESAEAAVVALGGSSPACFDVLRSWRARVQWEVALQPRGPGLHQLYRRPPLPPALSPALEQGIARGWERRAARGDLLARDMVQRAALSRAEPALIEAVEIARRRHGGGPVSRLDVSFGVRPHVSGRMTAESTSLALRLRPDWFRTVGHPRLALADGAFVVALDGPPLVVGWRETAAGWFPYLLDAG